MATAASVGLIGKGRYVQRWRPSEIEDDISGVTFDASGGFRTSLGPAATAVTPYAALIAAESDDVLVVIECVGATVHVLVASCARGASVERQVSMVTAAAGVFSAKPAFVSNVIEDHEPALAVAVDQEGGFLRSNWRWRFEISTGHFETGTLDIKRIEAHCSNTPALKHR